MNRAHSRHVGNVNVFGVGQYSMRVWLDPETLKARGLTPSDAFGAIRQQSQQVTGGQVGRRPPRQARRSSTVDVEGRLVDPAAFGDIVVKAAVGSGGQLTQVKDVARLELGAQTYSQSFEVNGEPAAGIAIFQAPDANAARRSPACRARMQALAHGFPQGLAWDVPFDTTRFVNASIDEVYKTLIEAGVLVLIVIPVFLRDWRATLVPATTVPVTIIGAFALMAAMGFAANLSTLFALVLSIYGIVVDDAIVVVEGAAHHLERGLSAHDAAVRAMQELFGPIIGITLVLMSVFVPAAFLPGLTGRMYAQFAIVIAATALLSAINAATLKPTQCALWLRPPVPPEQRNILSRAFNRAYAPLEHGYAALIGRMVRHAWPLALLALIAGGLGVWGVARLPSAFIPTEDQGYLVLGLQLPDGASLQRTDAVLARTAAIARATPGVAQVIEIAGISPLDNNASLASAGAVYVVLKDWSVRGRAEGRAIATHLQVAGRHDRRDRIRAAAAADPRASATPPASPRWSSNATAATTSPSWSASTRTVLADAAGQPALQRGLDVALGVPQIRVLVDRTKAEAAQACRSATCSRRCRPMSGRATSTSSTSLAARSRSMSGGRAVPAARTTSRNSRCARSGQMVPLGALGDSAADHRAGVGHVGQHRSSSRSDRRRAAPGYSTGEAMALMEQLADKALSPGTGFEWTRWHIRKKRSAGRSTWCSGWGCCKHICAWRRMQLDRAAVGGAGGAASTERAGALAAERARTGQQPVRESGWSC